MRDLAKFWDKVADGYARRPVPDEDIYQRKLAMTRDYLRPDSRVLEYGCGTGSTAIAHAPYVADITATDLSARMLEIAGEKAAAAGVKNVSFQHADVEDVAAPPESYDMVMAHSLLHLVDDLDGSLNCMHRALKPGGLFVASTVCLGEGFYKVFKVLGPIGSAVGLIPPIRCFSRGELADRILRAGFTMEQQWFPEGGRALFTIARKPS